MMWDMEDFEPFVKITTELERIPEESGVYIGFNGKVGDILRITYVGKTENLKRRLHKHGRSCTHYSFKVISKEEDRRELEKRLIEIFAPESNREFVDKSRTLSEEWVIKFDGGDWELWKRPDPVLDEDSSGYFPKKKVETLEEEL